MAQLESETRAGESMLLQEWYDSRALHEYNKRTAKHPKASADVYILAVKDMVWQQKVSSIAVVVIVVRASQVASD